MEPKNYKPLKILVISHDASLTGAPVLLLHTIRLLKERGCKFNALIRKNGPLREAFEKECERCMVLQLHKKEKLVKKVKRLLRSQRLVQMSLKSILRGVDIVLSNTITNGEVLAQIKTNSRCAHYKLYT